MGTEVVAEDPTEPAIVVLDGGRVLEDGSHDALLAQGGLYARLWSRQSGGFLALDPDAGVEAAE